MISGECLVARNKAFRHSHISRMEKDEDKYRYRCECVYVNINKRAKPEGA